MKEVVNKSISCLCPTRVTIPVPTSKLAIQSSTTLRSYWENYVRHNLVYLHTTPACDIHHIYFKNVETPVRIRMLWKEKFYCKRYRKMGKWLRRPAKPFMWKYSHQHMKFSDEHCATYALDGTCDHEHVGAYERCTVLGTFFNMSICIFS